MEMPVDGNSTPDNIMIQFRSIHNHVVHVLTSNDAPLCGPVANP